MNRKSFVDLTALLDVMLILFFAALINMASSADVLMEEKQNASKQLEAEKIKVEQSKEALDVVSKELEESKKELVTLYGTEIDDYKEILNKISKIDVMLVGESNEVWINNKTTDINIVREKIDNGNREEILEKDLKKKLNLAVDHREKSDIIFIKITVNDREVYKYAYDYLVTIVDEIVLEYGKDKVMMSREFD